MQEIKVLKTILPEAADMVKPVISVQISECEEKLANIAGQKNREIIEEASKEMNNNKGELNTNNMWKMKKRVFGIPSKDSYCFCIL